MPLTISGSEYEGLDTDDRLWLRWWKKREAEDFAAPPGFTPPLYADVLPDPRSQMRAHAASLVRAMSPKAWWRIAGRLRDESVLGWRDVWRVKESAAKLIGHPEELRFGRMLAGLVRKHAAENLDALPEAWTRPETETSR